MKMKHSLWFRFGCALVLALVFLVWKIPGVETSVTADTRRLPSMGSESGLFYDRLPENLAGDSKQLPVGGDYVRGNPQAAVTIVAFGDFQCPFCSRVQQTLDQVLVAYPNDVRIVWKHNPLPFHREAPLASQAALAAGEQGKFWEYHDLLFQRQGKFQRPALVQYAQELNLDVTRFKADLDSGRFQAQIDRDKALAQSIGVHGTPNFFINGIKLSGAQPLARFKALIDTELTEGRGDVYKVRVRRNLKVAAPLGAPRTAPTSAAARPQSASPRPVSPPPGSPTSSPQVHVIDVYRAPYKGASNAKVTVVMFADFQCPYSARSRTVLDALLQKYGNKLKVAFMHNPLAFHKEAPLAAQASMAANAQGKFWAYHDLLFQNQRALQRTHLESYAQQLGLNMKRFRAALDTQKYAQHIQSDQQAAKSVGARGTPIFFINGIKLAGAKPAAAFEALIDQELRKP